MITYDAATCSCVIVSLSFKSFRSILDLQKRLVLEEKLGRFVAHQNMLPQKSF